MQRLGTLRALLSQAPSAMRNKSVFDLLCQAYNEDEEAYKNHWMPYLQSAFARDPELWVPVRSLDDLELAHEVVPVGFFRLDLSDGRIRQVGCEGLAQLPLLAHVRQLDLSYSDLTPKDLKALAASPHLGNLAVLELSGNGIELEVCQEIMRASHLNEDAVISVMSELHPIYEALLERVSDHLAKGLPLPCWHWFRPAELTAMLGASGHEHDLWPMPLDFFDLFRRAYTYDPEFAQHTLAFLLRPIDPMVQHHAQQEWTRLGFAPGYVGAISLRYVQGAARSMVDAYAKVQINPYPSHRGPWTMNWTCTLPRHTLSALDRIQLPMVPSFDEVLWPYMNVVRNHGPIFSRHPDRALAETQELADTWQEIGLEPELAKDVASCLVLRLHMHMKDKISAHISGLQNVRLLELEGFGNGARLPDWIGHFKHLEILLLHDFSAQRLPKDVMQLPTLKVLGLKGPGLPLTENIRNQIEHLQRTRPDLEVI